MSLVNKYQKRERRHTRIRAKISGTKKRPRLCVFKSSNHIYAQLIDDENSKTLIAVNDSKVSKVPKDKNRKVAVAHQVGVLIAEEAKKLKIEEAVFDRGGFVFCGRIKAVAEGAREGGLKF
ncbi:MAG: 50S ribosomal protein L18 [Candidatus Staskawiczbacteria bacterium]|jgi:large subunit ribosomal protein L18